MCFVFITVAPQYTGYGKVGVDRGSTANIPCEVSSYPPVTSIKFLTEAREEISPNSRYGLPDIKYEVDGLAYRQRRKLVISNVISSDYKPYYCVATSNEGSTEQPILLSPTTVPDNPTELDISNIAWDSVTLTWLPGYNGGLTQSYKIVREDERSKESHTEQVTTLTHVVMGESLFMVANEHSAMLYDIQSNLCSCPL